MAHYLLQDKDIMTKFWVESIYYDNYLLNLVLTRVVSSMTPIKKWCGKKPSVSHLRTFGCVTRENIFDACKNNLDAKSHACIMIGYFEKSKSYQLFDLVNKQIIIRRNVIFDENNLGLKFLNSSSSILNSDPFDIIPNSRLNDPLNILTSSSTSIPKSNGS